MELFSNDVIKLLIAVLIGGIIGAEREVRSKAAGFRTIILICVGATLFTIVSLSLGGDKDPVRMAANIITGIGFLGAGVIFQDAGRVSGLTTASTIWIAAALGMSIGGGLFSLAAFATALVVMVLWAFSKLEIIIDKARRSRTYEVTFHDGEMALDELRTIFRESGLKCTELSLARRNGDIISTIDAHGRTKDHDAVTKKLFADKHVKEVKY